MRARGATARIPPGCVLQAETGRATRRGARRPGVHEEGRRSPACDRSREALGRTA